MAWRVAAGVFLLGAVAVRVATTYDSCTYTFNVDSEHGCSVADDAVRHLASTVNELQAQVTSLLRQNANLHDDNAYWRELVQKKLDMLPGSTHTGVGAQYIRWGRTVCPANSSLVYSGVAAGSHFTHTGGSSELMCLPDEPEWGRFVDGYQGESYVYGTEYETGHKYGANDVFLKHNIHGQSLHNHNVPCAVCYTPGRSTAMKFPAKRQCPAGWSHEYDGYLMSGHYSHKTKIPAVCLDEAPEVGEGGAADSNGVVFYNMEAQCGSLPCPNYIAGRELTCVICSR